MPRLVKPKTSPRHPLRRVNEALRPNGVSTKEPATLDSMPNCPCLEQVSPKLHSNFLLNKYSILINSASAHGKLFSPSQVPTLPKICATSLCAWNSFRCSGTKDAELGTCCRPLQTNGRCQSAANCAFKELSALNGASSSVLVPSSTARSP